VENYKWIRPNMDLYKNIDPQNIICVKNSGVLEDDFYRYAKDFNEAANILMQHLIKDAANRGNIAQLDLWYFSLVYLYRQSLELLLKANILRFEKDANLRSVILKNVSHDVKAAFDELIKLSGLDISDNKNAEWLSSFLADITRLDKDSDMFRYPFGNKMQVLFERQTHVYLPAAYYNMNRAFELLDEFYKKDIICDKKYPPEVIYEPKLIIEGGIYNFQSVVGYKYSEGKYFPYNTSYQECGEFLDKTIKETGKTNLFMPMCYLYRNAVELGLKKIIMESSKLDKATALKAIRRKQHSLVGLWNKIADELRSYAYDGDPIIDYVEQYIHSFHEFDISSDIFRYPCNKEMKVYFLNETRLDIENVSDCFVELIHFLDGADCMLLQEREWESEMEAYYR